MTLDREEKGKGLGAASPHHQRPNPSELNFSPVKDKLAQASFFDCTTHLKQTLEPPALAVKTATELPKCPRIFIQHIVTLSKYGHSGLDIRRTHLYPAIYLIWFVV